MTQLVEDITIKITLNHCEGDSKVIGGDVDLRRDLVDWLDAWLPDFLRQRVMHNEYVGIGMAITYTNTGLQEVPELSGGDN